MYIVVFAIASKLLFELNTDKSQRVVNSLPISSVEILLSTTKTAGYVTMRMVRIAMLLNSRPSQYESRKKDFILKFKNDLSGR